MYPTSRHRQHHQHFMCFRIDPAVDDEEGGRHLTVTEVNAEPEHLSATNPFGVAFKVTETPLTCEAEAQRHVDTVKSRSWKIKNYNSINPVNNEPVSYKLVPHPSPPLYCHPTSVHAARAVWAQRHLWVTQYNEGELYPAGEYPLALEGSRGGIEAWTKQVGGGAL